MFKTNREVIQEFFIKNKEEWIQPVVIEKELNLFSSRSLNKLLRDGIIEKKKQEIGTSIYTSYYRLKKE